MHIYDKSDYIIKANTELPESIIELFPEKIFNAILHTKWHSFKYDVYNTTLPIDIKILYNLNINEKILAFAYALLSNKKTKHLTVVLKIIPSHDIKQIDSLWSKNYLFLEKIDLKIPLKVFICKQLYITINKISDVVCNACKSNIYQNINECWNKTCSKFKKPNLNNFIISNKDSKIIHTLEYTQKNSLLKYNIDNLNTYGGDCIKCQSCKLCSKNSKCRFHKICNHKKTYNQLKGFHHLNKLALQSALKDIHIKKTNI
uniref:Uncharacterized protein n=1 Tax=Faxonius propinquus nudivirus TaxID=3139431 RepID=A0AAU8GFP5_9VIRU